MDTNIIVRLVKRAQRSDLPKDLRAEIARTAESLFDDLIVSEATQPVKKFDAAPVLPTGKTISHSYATLSAQSMTPEGEYFPKWLTSIRRGRDKIANDTVTFAKPGGPIGSEKRTTS